MNIKSNNIGMSQCDQLQRTMDNVRKIKLPSKLSVICSYTMFPLPCLISSLTNPTSQNVYENATEEVLFLLVQFYSFF